MLNVAKIIVACLIAFGVIGCNHSGGHKHHSEHKDHTGHKDIPAKAGGIEKTVEVACGSCIYEMEGVQGCKTAVKIDGKPYLVTGGSLDAHTSGLCSGEKQAVVAGEVKDGKFVASKIELVGKK